VGSVNAPLIAAIGVAVVMAVLVGSTAIGSGDYGQWLMVSRGFNDLATPAYRDLAQVPPLAPALIALLHGLLGEPTLALRAAGALTVGAMGGALAFAGWAVAGRWTAGLLAAVLGLLVSDQYLDLLAFGALPQALAVVFLTLAIACFVRAITARTTERRWWLGGCAALFLACLSHVATSTIALPACLVAAGLGVLPRGGERPATRLRRSAPLGIGLALIGAYWLVAIAPASAPYVANPASLSYRGPDRLIDQLFGFAGTAAIVAGGAIALAAWAGRRVFHGRLPAASDPRTALAAWALASWASFGLSAVAQAATDYPRFAPLLIVPLVVILADGLVTAAAWINRRFPRRATGDHGLVALALGIVVVAPFSIASYQTEAWGYRLPDQVALAAAASWADARLQPGATILAPVREAKWIEGLTGRSTLFSSMVRYAFRPAEWDRSLAANALMRGDLALVNESFALTLNDGAPLGDGEQPRGLLVSMNHGGDWLDIVRLVPASSVILDDRGATLASLPSLTPTGIRRSTSSASVAALTSWSTTRSGAAIDYGQSVRLERGSAAFTFNVAAQTTLPIGGLRAELRPATGAAITNVAIEGGSAVATFARAGRIEPRIRIQVADGTVSQTASGGLALSTSSKLLSVTVTDLTAGTASSSLRLLDPAELVDEYAVGAAVLLRDPAYEDRRDRLELLGFRVAHAEGPYIVMVRAGWGVPAAATANP
jgi:hypothetical protein